jgi:hypothetical protein
VLDQGDVVGMFIIGLPDHSGLPMRAATIVSSSEAVKSQYPGASCGQVVEGSASDASSSHHDGIVV